MLLREIMTIIERDRSDLHLLIGTRTDKAGGTDTEWLWMEDEQQSGKPELKWQRLKEQAIQ